MEVLPHEKQINEYVQTIEHLKRQSAGNTLFHSEIAKLERNLDKLKRDVYAKLTPWERVMICRHPGRPHTIDYVTKMFDSFEELSGDRTFRDDHAVIGGFAYLDGVKCMVIGQEKGNDTESRIDRNFGMVSPEGFRKALRLMQMAEKFRLPIVSLLDTPGAYPGLEAEERGQGWAIAKNLFEMSRIKTPIVVVVIGEGCSGGALGMGVGDVVGMLEHAYYSVISPEGCASILWKDVAKNKDAAAALKMQAEHLLEMEIIDQMIPEPVGGAHHDPAQTLTNVKEFVLSRIQILKNIPVEILLEQRYLKFRKMGKYETTVTPS